jgi:hypothetical protein
VSIESAICISNFDESNSYQILTQSVGPNKLSLIKKEFDLVINATNNEIKDNTNTNSFFELTISLIYKNTKKLEFDALTMVDGNLFSIYPYSEDKFTITDVEHTPIKKFKTANNKRNKQTQETTQEI